MIIEITIIIIIIVIIITTIIIIIYYSNYNLCVGVADHWIVQNWPQRQGWNF